MLLLFVLIRHAVHSLQRRKPLHYQLGPFHAYADPCDLSMYAFSGVLELLFLTTVLF